MMSLDFVLLGVVKYTDSYAQGRETKIPPKIMKKLLASSLSYSLFSIKFRRIGFFGWD
jgi:hypothetical protein